MSGAAAFTQGALMMAGLIVAIGAQNALVLRQGLARHHVGAVVALCALSDVLLVVVGVFGFGAFIASVPWLLDMLRWGGALFLVVCGLAALRRVAAPGAGLRGAGGRASLTATLGQTAALTWLNPHVYLDTVVLLGTVGAQQPASLRAPFAAGAGTASVLWFFALGFGAAALAPWLAPPQTWRVIDGGVALVMFTVAWQLVATAP